MIMLIIEVTNNCTNNLSIQTEFTQQVFVTKCLEEVLINVHVA